MKKGIIKYIVLIAVIAASLLFTLSACNTNNEIKFETFGGTEIRSQSVKKGESVALPSTAPSKDGFIFGGWYKDADYDDIYDFSKEAGKNTTVYAKWITTENSFNHIENEDGNSVTITGLKTKANWLKEITIPESIGGKKVTEISESAFFANFDIVRVIFQDESVTSIGKYAFMGNINLKEINLPSTLVEIQYGAFATCKNLTEIIIPNSVETMGKAVFNDCEKLSKIYFNIGIAGTNWASEWKVGCEATLLSK